MGVTVTYAVRMRQVDTRNCRCLTHTERIVWWRSERCLSPDDEDAGRSRPERVPVQFGPVQRIDLNQSQRIDVELRLKGMPKPWRRQRRRSQGRFSAHPLVLRELRHSLELNRPWVTLSVAPHILIHCPKPEGGTR